jgi:hypothetical protein
VPSTLTLRRTPDKSGTAPTPAGARSRTKRPGLASPQLLGALSIKLEDSRVGAGAAASLEPIEQLRRRVDLVVVAAIGESRQLVQILREPRCRTRQVDKAVLDHRDCGALARHDERQSPP